MVKTTVLLKDVNFRFVIPKHVREIENLQIGDTVEITVKKVMTESAKTKAFKARFDEEFQEKISLLAPGALQALGEKRSVEK